MGPGLACMRLAANPLLSCLRAHYNAGLVHAGCKAWDDALDLLNACIVVSCLAVGLIAVAARKKGLLVRYLLLGGKELDGERGGGTAAAGGGEGGHDVSRLERYRTNLLLACLNKVRC